MLPPPLVPTDAPSGTVLFVAWFLVVFLMAAWFLVVGSEVNGSDEKKKPLGMAAGGKESVSL